MEIVHLSLYIIQKYMEIIRSFKCTTDGWQFRNQWIKIKLQKSLLQERIQKLLFECTQPQSLKGSPLHVKVLPPNSPNQEGFGHCKWLSNWNSKSLLLHKKPLNYLIHPCIHLYACWFVHSFPSLILLTMHVWQRLFLFVH